MTTKKTTTKKRTAKASLKASAKSGIAADFEMIKEETVTELVEKKRIEDSPFTAVRHDEEWHLCMGKYRLAGPYKTEEETREDSKDVSWDRLLTIMSIMITEAEEVKKLQSEVTRLNGTVYGEEA